MKWFAGNKERSVIATQILSELADSLNNSEADRALKSLILQSLAELESQNRLTIAILNSFNIEASNCLLKNHIQLNKQQANDLRQLRELSQIKYGNLI